MSAYWDVTDKIPGSFTKINADAYYALATLVLREVAHPVFVEVGVDQGRSASVLFQAIQNAEKWALLILVDSWESVLVENKDKVRALADRFQTRYIVLHMTSVQAAPEVADESVDMLLIDANHTEHHPDEDARLWLPKLKSGGIACFHDFDSGFTAVDEAIARWTGNYEDLGNHDGLAVRRKP